ncbi:MAG: hypothetical protein MUC33_00905 [Desulfobacterales bacterium]|nr:hypothetical protein [Desulfobacterales bacterium]
MAFGFGLVGHSVQRAPTIQGTACKGCSGGLHLKIGFLYRNRLKTSNSERESKMKKILVVFVAMSFVLAVSGPSFAQNPSTTAQEKAGDNATFNRGDAKPTAKPNADKVKAEKEKAVKEKGDKEKAAKEKVEKEKGAKEKAVKEKGKAAQNKTKFNPDDVKKQ